MSEEVNRELQERLLILQQLQSEAESVQKKIFEIDILESEIEKTIETLEYFDSLDDGVDALMNLGSGVFAYVDVKEAKKMLVDVGAGVVIEREVKDVVEILRKRKDKVQESKEQYTQLLERIYSEAKKIQSEVAKMSKEE